MAPLSLFGGRDANGRDALPQRAYRARCRRPPDGRAQAGMSNGDGPARWEANMPNHDGTVDPDITVTDELDPAELAVITDGLRAYDLSQAGYYDFRPLAVFVHHPQDRKVLGWLHRGTEIGLVYVAWFFLPEDL